jgi:hypothetical protein
MMPLTPVSHPLAASPSQSAKPKWQVGRHTPAEHAAVWFGPAVQVCPQAPQFVTLKSVRTSQPFVAFLSQLAKPTSQVSPQVDIAQVGVESGPEAHARPQAPQWTMSVRGSTQTPEQFKRPAGHMTPESTGGITHAPAPKPQLAPVHVPSVDPAAAPERQRPVPAQKPQPAMAVQDPQPVRAAQGSVPPSSSGITTSGRATSIAASRPEFDGSPQAASAANAQPRISGLAVIRNTE